MNRKQHLIVLKMNAIGRNLSIPMTSAGSGISVKCSLLGPERRKEMECGGRCGRDAINLRCR
ncbi:hypothetical protein ANCCAN_15675 [Ancylostoma caninum]|uniref:Uncharacterized protein n=1 Tax=Ancylostoma caninum TaxID=29170 RepID=A0A368G3X6_ANCCA|nr:hypothetical protein ANCCAN_15675 [Ancylostoma caninum]